MIGLPFLSAEDHPACAESPSLFFDDDWLATTDANVVKLRKGDK